MEQKGSTMRRYLVLIVVLGMMAIPAAALAAPPEVVVDETFSDTFLNGEVSAACAFDVWTMDTSSTKVTLFFNKDGSVNHEGIHVTGATEWMGPSGATAWEHWAWSGKYFPETDTFTQSGNVFNIHAGAGGVLVNDKGKIVFRPGRGHPQRAARCMGRQLERPLRRTVVEKLTPTTGWDPAHTA